MRTRSVTPDSALMKSVRSRAARAARSDTNVLLTGESGTGKTMLAHEIHEQSGRSGEFVTCNCAIGDGEVIRDMLFGHEKGSFTNASERYLGFFEQANNGTLFLDEIGRAPLSVQSALLKAVDEKIVRRLGGKVDTSVDVRLIAATSADLKSEVERGTFLKDLWYRISGIRLHLPPLRERPEEVLPLAEHFLTQWEKRNMRDTSLVLTEKARSWLLSRQWPGNARELRSTVEGAATMCNGERIDQADLELADVEFAEELATSEQRWESLAASLVLALRDRGVLDVSNAVLKTHPGKNLRQVAGEIYHHLKPLNKMAPDRRVDSSEIALLRDVANDLPALFTALANKNYTPAANKLFNELAQVTARSSSHSSPFISPVLPSTHGPIPAPLLPPIGPTLRAAAPPSLVSHVRLDSVVAEMRALNGAFLSSEQADGLAARQEAALIGMFADPGLRHASSLWEYPLAELATAEDSNDLDGFVGRMLGRLHDFRTAVAAPDPEPVIASMLEYTCDAYAYIRYGEPWSLESSLFAEFFLGLLCFEVTAHVGPTLGALGLLRSRLDAATSVTSYVAGLRGVFVLHRHFLDRLNQTYSGALVDDVWRDVHSTWSRSAAHHRGFVDALKRVASLRHLPLNRPEIPTLAQVSHWLMFGGRGELLESVRDVSAPVQRPLLDALSDNAHHSFNWHGLHADDNPGMAHFDARRKQFSRSAEALGEYAAACTSALAAHARLRSLHSSKSFRIWGDAVGPTRVAEKRLLINLQKLTKDPMPRYDLVASEVGGASLARLIQAPRIEPIPGERLRVVMRDLNLPFPGEPGGPSARGELSPFLKAGTYDVYSCSIALHQIADTERGVERLLRILAFGTRLVRSGGVLSLPDVGPGGAFEAYLLPVNFVDREGAPHVASLFDQPPYGLTDVACTIDGRFLTDTDIEGAPSELHCKVPLPLPRLSLNLPDALAHYGHAIYTYTPLLVVDMALEDLLTLEAKWHAAGEGDMGRTVRERLTLRAIEARWGNAEEILADVVASMIRLGSSPRSSSPP